MLEVGFEFQEPFSSNRTFMELKFISSPWQVWQVSGSNRTFMELK